MGLPLSKKNAIFVIIYRLIKIKHFIPYFAEKKIFAKKIAVILLRHV